ncbi:MAG: 30S ribosome-binding factor RbfA [Clostridiales Family XIII bacterium]|jgi:ribosome-binding factor A|nr:30S ribosome-binding factor RbfA [Clostridiales Family XIII bacterium]
MKKSYRTDRMAEEIRRIVSEMFLRELKDPGLKGVAGISDVEVTGDGSFATLYILVSCDPDRDSADDREKQDVLDAFHRAKGLLRREIGARLQLKHTPDLIFKIDVSQEYGRHIDRIFEELNGERSSGRDNA